MAYCNHAPHASPIAHGERGRNTRSVADYRFTVKWRQGTVPSVVNDITSRVEDLEHQVSDMKARQDAAERQQSVKVQLGQPIRQVESIDVENRGYGEDAYYVVLRFSDGTEDAAPLPTPE